MNFLRGIIQATLYVRVHADRMAVRHIESGRESVVQSSNTFTTSRLLIGDFVEAVATLRDAMTGRITGTLSWRHRGW